MSEICILFHACELQTLFSTNKKLFQLHSAMKRQQFFAVMHTRLTIWQTIKLFCCSFFPLSLKQFIFCLAIFLCRCRGKPTSTKKNQKSSEWMAKMVKLSELRKTVHCQPSETQFTLSGKAHSHTVQSYNSTINKDSKNTRDKTNITIFVSLRYFFVFCRCWFTLLFFF